MRKLNCRLIVSDFDGTLANSANEIDKENLKAIKEYEKNGGVFAVCTGRILGAIIGRLRELGFSGLVVAGQGSTIADVKSGAILRNVDFTREQALEISRAMESLGINIQAYGVCRFFSSLPADDVYLNRYESIIGLKAERAGIVPSEYIEKNDISCGKFTTMCAPGDREELYKKLSDMLGDKYDVTCSAVVLIEISPKGITKGEALKFLADYYGVPIDKTCAVGDNLNDLSMIEAAGYGVAVANGTEELLNRAKLITASNDDFAIAKVIEEYGYKHD